MIGREKQKRGENEEVRKKREERRRRKEKETVWRSGRSQERSKDRRRNKK